MPCLNEARTVGQCVTQALQALDNLKVAGEVIVVDNGSSDSSAKVAGERGARVITELERGYGRALRAGFEAARGRFIIMGDSDGTFDFNRIGELLEAVRSGADLVIGDRFKGGVEKGAMPFLNRYAGIPALTCITNLLFATSIPDSQCGVRAFSAKAFREWRLVSIGMELASEINAKAALCEHRIEHVPILHERDGRHEGSSHLRPFRDGLRHLILLLKIFLFGTYRNQVAERRWVIHRLQSNAATLLEVIVCLGLGALFYYIALNRNSLLEFDESNTLRIASTSPATIIAILKHEQNFPLYYLFLHILGANQAVIKSINLLAWLFTLYFARRILSVFISNPLARASGLVVFAVTPYIIHYIYYCRVYTLTNLILTAQAYILITAINGATRWLSIGRVLAILATALHPLGILAALLFCFSEMLFVKSRPPFAPIITMCLSVFCFAAHFLSKIDPVSIYFGHGVNYLDSGGTSLAKWGPVFFASAYFYIARSPFTYILFLAAIFLGVSTFLAQHLYQDRRFGLLLLLALAFVGLPLFLPNGAADHHAAFFIAPFALMIIIACHRGIAETVYLPLVALAAALVVGSFTWVNIDTQQEFSLNGKILLNVVGVLIIIGFVLWPNLRDGQSRKIIHMGRLVFGLGFVLASIAASSHALAIRFFEYDDINETACDYFHHNSDSNQITFTDFTRYNVIDYCRRFTVGQHVAFAETAGLLDTTNLSREDVLLEQARRGGKCDAPSTIIHYLNSSDKVRELIAQHVPERIVLFYPRQGCFFGLSLQSVNFPGYRFEECVSPAQFVFLREN